MKKKTAVICSEFTPAFIWRAEEINENSAIINNFCDKI
jgi:hypothetical protein